MCSGRFKTVLATDLFLLTQTESTSRLFEPLIFDSNLLPKF